MESSRRILHCDMDCFYAAVHMRDDPSLKGKPVVIGGSPEGRGVVAAASYEARAFGIHSAQPAARAVRLCPDAIFIRPEFPRYRAESEQVFEIFRQFTSVIQPVSIDEAFLDVTDEIDRWGSATALATEVKRRVADERDLTVSIGVAPNKLVAKIASDHDKPDGLTVVPPKKIQRFLDPLSVRALPGVGPATQARLKKVAIETVAELRAVPLDRLEGLFGRHGRGLYNYARGIDERPVRISRQRKSLSSERTFSRDLETLDQMDAELDRLAERVSSGLRKKQITACTVTLKVRYADFTTISRSQTLGAPTADEGVLARHAKALLRTSEAGNRTVRLLGLGASNLIAGELEQLELFA